MVNQPAKQLARWVPANETVAVHGVSIPGMVYVGEWLKASAGGIDPALIDPSLAVNTRQPDSSEASLTYWPSYSALSPASRAGYLEWLAAGRRNPAAPIGFVFLFFYGLERRIFVDIRQDESLAGELPVIEEELQALLGIYGERSGSFRQYAGALCDLIRAFLGMRQPVARLDPPPLAGRGPDLPPSLRLGLARIAADQRPVPAAWALAWAWYSPDIPMRTPASRCPDMFARLFAVRYLQAHGEGMLPARGKRRLVLAYRPATAGIHDVRIPVEGVTDISELPSSVRKLRELMDRVADELDPYSRWVGKRPENDNMTLEAIALLPIEIVDESFLPVRRLQDWAGPRLEASQSFAVPGIDILRLWNEPAHEALGRPASVRLTQAFERAGLGLEPDIRFGGPPISAVGKAVVFQVESGAGQSASPEYQAATTLLHLASAVGVADGTISTEEVEHMALHVESSLHLSAGERVRLQAHLRWLATTEVKLTGLKNRLDALTIDQRAAIGRTAVAVATVDGDVSPAEVRILNRLYGLLGINERTVTSDVHQALTTVRPPAGTDPVVVRPATLEEPGYRIPPRPATGLLTAETAAIVMLDDRRIQETLRSTAHVSALLGDIFAEEDLTAEPPSGPPLPNPAAIPAAPVVGLDAPHAQLLRAMAVQPRLGRQAFAELADVAGLMPDGALDVINEAALDAIDEVVIDQDADGNLTIQVELIKEMLA